MELMEIGFKRNKMGECIFSYQNSVYWADSILMGPNTKEINKVMKKINKKIKIQS